MRNLEPSNCAESFRFHPTPVSFMVTLRLSTQHQLGICHTAGGRSKWWEELATWRQSFGSVCASLSKDSPTLVTYVRLHFFIQKSNSSISTLFQKKNCCGCFILIPRVTKYQFSLYQWINGGSCSRTFHILEWRNFKLPLDGFWLVKLSACIVSINIKHNGLILKFIWNFHFKVTISFLLEICPGFELMTSEAWIWICMPHPFPCGTAILVSSQAIFWITIDARVLNFVLVW